jgi:ribulose-phosphate 3-epimerase
MNHILPAVIPHTEAELRATLARLSFARAIQIDVVDGSFAAPASWPYDPSGSPMDIADALTPFDVEVDLMAYRPIEAAYEWHRAGVNRFVFHIETLENASMLASFKAETGVVVGCSLSNDTPLSALQSFHDTADFIQLMGIAHIGVQHEPFDERVLTRIHEVKQQYPSVSITVDGSVNQDTIMQLRDAGADRFAVGSAILTASDPEAAYRELQNA